MVVEKRMINVVEDYKGGKMKKILFILAIVFTFASCSSTKTKENLVQKYSITKEAARNWDVTISQVMVSEAKLPDWYGEENPILNLRRHGRMTEKEYYFLDALSKIPAEQMSDEDFDRFVEIMNGYVKRMPRKFFLEETNIKDPIGLVRYMVMSSNSRLDNPSKYIKEVVSDKEEWEKIVNFSKKDDLNEKDVKKLRNLLSSFMKKPNFFNADTWYQVEVSDRVMQLDNLSKKENKTKLELNNINSKAMYLAYPQSLSPLDRWSR